MRTFVAANAHGTMAEWLGNGLQNRLQQFDSAWYLGTIPMPSGRRDFFSAQCSVLRAGSGGHPGIFGLRPQHGAEAEGGGEGKREKGEEGGGEDGNEGEK